MTASKGVGRGFASLPPERRKIVAAMGGRAVPPRSRTFFTDRALAARAGQKGGRVKPGRKTLKTGAA
jgi:general stress protein YciG